MAEGSDNTNQPENEAQARRGSRRQAVMFVLVFVCVSLALLTSYRFAIHTRINDWYLYQAASHTAWTLGWIGDGVVEPYHFGKHNPQQMRAAITAWRTGKDAPTAEDIALTPPTMLTPWERWSYRALEARRNPTGRDNGPRVYFVLRHGNTSNITRLSAMINAIESDLGITPGERKERLAPLQEELSQLREEQRTVRSGDTGTDKEQSLFFSFILVPECGAIEIMAIFIAAILAFPTAWRKRMFGIFVGTPIMYCVNIFRLSVLAIIGAVDQSQGRVWFNFAHEYVWQAVYIVFVVAVWLLWVEYVVKGKRS